jgi:hypothetical protein
MERPGAITPGVVAKVAGLLLVLALGGYLATRTGDYLDTYDVNGTGESALDVSGARTAQGGSAFSAPDPRNPVGYVEATFTVLFRPLPFEAHTAESIATSIEGLFLLVLCLASWRRLATIPRRLRSEPYVALAVAYVLMFFFAFGTISNFGILARERSMAMPFVLVLLSVTVLPSRAKSQPPRIGGTRRPPVMGR